LLKLKAKNQMELKEPEEVPKRPLIKLKEKVKKPLDGQKKRSMSMPTVVDHHQEEETKVMTKNLPLMRSRARLANTQEKPKINMKTQKVKLDATPEMPETRLKSMFLIGKM